MSGFKMNERYLGKKTIDFVVFCSQKDRPFGDLLINYLNEDGCSCMFDDITYLKHWETYDLHVPDQLCKLAYYKLILVSVNMIDDDMLDLHKCEQLTDSITKNDFSVVPVFLNNRKSLEQTYGRSSKMYGLTALSGVYLLTNGTSQAEERKSFLANLEKKTPRIQNLKERICEMKLAGLTPGTSDEDLQEDRPLPYEDLDVDGPLSSSECVALPYADLEVDGPLSSSESVDSYNPSCHVPKDNEEMEEDLRQYLQNTQTVSTQTDLNVLIDNEVENGDSKCGHLHNTASTQTDIKGIDHDLTYTEALRNMKKVGKLLRFCLANLANLLFNDIIFTAIR